MKYISNKEMKKIFECSNGVEFFTDGESILGVLSKEEAIEFVAEIARAEIEIEDYEGFDVSLKLLASIQMSYIQTSEITIIIQ